MVYSVFDELPSATGNSTAQVKFVIQQHIEHLHYEDALILAELIHEKVNSDETLHLLCNCLLLLSRIEDVYALLSLLPKNSSRIRYLYGKCCFDLKKYEECLKVLLDDNLEIHPVIKDTPSDPYARNLLSVIFTETGRSPTAQLHCSKSITLNPLIWSCVEAFSKAGGSNIKSLYQEENLLENSSENAPIENEDTTKKTPVTMPMPKNLGGAPKKVSRTMETRRSSRLGNQEVENMGRLPTRLATRIRSSTRSDITPTLYSAKTKEISVPRRPRDAKQPLTSRNSNAIRSLSSSSTSVEIPVATPIPTETVKKEAEGKGIVSDMSREIFDTVKLLAAINDAVSTFNWSGALQLFDELPRTVSKYAITLHLRARMKFEQSEYAATRDIVQELRRLYPHRLEGSEILSTALWHLQEQHSLSALAQELTTNARRRPQTWCVAGNCFSLQRQHAQAVECMERAIHLDPHFSYAYTLLGHELVFQEELEKASKAFRSALDISPNDYRAWYGLGQVNQRNEQLHLAQSNMAKALDINKNSRAMLCTLAQVEQALSRPDRAMILLDRALTINPNDVACRYNRARLLFETKQYEKCVSELNELKGFSPDEAYIFHLLGKVHRRLGNTHLALLHYSWAAEMDPRGEQMLAHGAGADNRYDDDSYSPETE